ncbi:MAG: hypothetical protein J4432_00695 [DPANN group archaeon]|nr:hypothetical protein [DPANN group archaeon]
MNVHQSAEGILVEDRETKLFLDPSRQIKPAQGIVGISHAHQDHVRNHKTECILTPATSDLFHASEAKRKKHAYGKKTRLDNLVISMHSANHILGSSQFRIENSQVLTYTGDFKLQRSLLYPKCDVIDTDILIMEATYGSPEYVFPNPDGVYRDMGLWIKSNPGKNVIIGAYALGKSQELIKALNEMSIVPVTHPSVTQNSEVYKKHGASIEYIDSESPEGNEVMKQGFVGIVPRHLLKYEFIHGLEMQYMKPVLTSFVSGWATKYNFGVDKTFILSDHADFSQLMSYAELSGAKQIYTVHGQNHELARQIRKQLGIPAIPLADKAQKTLAEY